MVRHRPACAKRWKRLTQAVVKALLRSRPGGGTFHIEDVQDQVELGLMRGSHHEVARAYVLYRERRTQERAAKGEREAPQAAPEMHVLDNGQKVPLDMGKLHARAADPARACCGPECRRQARSPSWPKPCATCTTACRWKRCYKASILAARTLIET
jgi:ribonucleoside-diphosphate reductase alpha chain